MKILNATVAYKYLDGLTDDRDRSAALAIHLAYMDHCSSLAKAKRIIASTPLDMAILYRAAVAAFRPSSGEASECGWSVARIVNGEQANQKLAAIAGDRCCSFASRFLLEAHKKSDGSPSKPDLLFLLDLFLMTLKRCTPEATESGEISRASRRVMITDYW